jgi:segregation and condensation protein B
METDALAVDSVAHGEDAFTPGPLEDPTAAAASTNVEGAGAPADVPAADATGGLAAVLESMLFAAGAPVPVARLVQALDGPSRAEVVEALDALGARYEREGRGLRLVHVAGGYQLRTPAAHGRWVRRLLQERPPRLSRPMLETLAIVAYRQPCTRIEIEGVRGVDCDAVLATLTDRRLVRILGRKEAPGRPLLYGTTREFLEVFGLPDLSALPTLRELGEEAQVLEQPDLTVTPAGVVATPEAPPVEQEAATEETALPEEAPAPEEAAAPEER